MWSSEEWRWFRTSLVLSSGALKSFLLLEVSPCIYMITIFNTLHFYSLVHFELGHSLSFMPCFVITVLFIHTPRPMYQQFLHQAMKKRAVQTIGITWWLQEYTNSIKINAGPMSAINCAILWFCRNKWQLIVSARVNVLVKKVFTPFTPNAFTLVELVEVQRSQFLLSACEGCHRCFTPLARLPPLARRSHNKSSML